jgi:hypothetical protein
MSWCALWKVVNRVREEGESVEELLDWRGYRKNAVRWRRLSVTVSATTAFAGLRHDALRGRSRR